MRGEELLGKIMYAQYGGIGVLLPCLVHDIDLILMSRRPRKQSLKKMSESNQHQPTVTKFPL